MATPEPRLSTLQQERSRQTRDNLLRAANTLWRQKGFAETTVSEICDAAGVAKGTFYFYFPHKEDLLLELGLASSERVAGMVAEADDAITTEELLSSIVAGVASRMQRTSKELLELTIIEMYRSIDTWQERRRDRQDFRSIFRRVLERGQKRGEVRADLDPEDAASAMTASITQGMLQWAQGRSRNRSLGDVLQGRIELLFRGAST
jgi:AcrR family transcriptional regulator